VTEGPSIGMIFAATQTTPWTELAGERPLLTPRQASELRGLFRNGHNVYYRITDPCGPTLLDRGWCLIEDT
jgi:hypothetical protein